MSSHSTGKRRSNESRETWEIVLSLVGNGVFQALINLVSVKAPRLERRLENLEVEINLFECLEWVAMSELNMKVCT